MHAALSHYRILEKIGAGGMGVVYRAHDEHLDCDVALKVLSPGKLTDEAARKRFRREALALSKLNHPNITVVHDFDTQDGTDFLVEELIPGRSLSEMLVSGPLPEREIVNLGTQLCEGLAAAHEHGVIHRDLKPANIRVTPDGRLKILDFGLARITQPSSPTAATASETQVPSFAGTLPYMAPEQLLDQKADPRTDIWAVGCVLCEMATGRPPFLSYGPALIDAILHQPAPVASKLNLKLSPGLEAIILRCLDKSPENRYQSAKELAVDLRRRALPLAAASSGAAPRARRSWVRKAVVTASLIAIAAIVLAGVLFVRSRRARVLTVHDTIVLADFDNKTGDAVFDDALKQALAVGLGQSPFLNVLSDRKVSETLRMMGRSANERITADVGRELCLRTGSKALLGGTISSLGSHYLIGLTAVACSTGDTLAKEQGEATSKEGVLKALSGASSSLRIKLGESLPSVQKFAAPIDEVTTTSFEALKAFSMGRKTSYEKGDQAALPYYRRALELDPNFALAYGVLGTAYHNLRLPTLARKNAKKAYDLRGQVSEREKYRIESNYYDFVSGELGKANQACEMWKQTYQRDFYPPIILGDHYMTLGQWDKALRETQQGMLLEPNVVVMAGNLAQIQLALNQTEDARTTVEQALARKQDSHYLRLMLYQAAFIRGDRETIQQQLAWAAGRSGDEDVLLNAQSDTEAYFGQLGKAREFSQRAIDSAKHADAKEAAALWQTYAALREAEFGNARSARLRARAALALVSGKDVKSLAALALALVGDAAEVHKLADTLNKDFPLDTTMQGYWLPAIRAAVELNRRNAAAAVELLKAAGPYELSQVGALYPVYLRGQAYLLGHQGREAATEFQKIIDHRGIVVNIPVGALALLGLGRAYALQGDSARARAAYQDFLTLWKDADPDIPILKQAKAEYAKLQRG